jgi:hypothetical protein
MGLASYEIVGDAGAWHVGHDGKAEIIKPKNPQAAVAAASLALRQGHEVRIMAPGNGTATGAANPGYAYRTGASSEAPSVKRNTRSAKPRLRSRTTPTAPES